MILDEHLLKKAHEAEGQLAAAERSVEGARAELHTAIRRMHLAGGSLREIAEALGISHQRVQQIVSSAGGTWWTRVWRTRKAKADMVCTFCERPPSELVNLLAGPNVYICDDCVAAAARALAGGGARGSSGFVASKPGSKTPCSFCGRRAGADRRVARGDASGICGECVEVSRQILCERGHPRTAQT